MVTNYLRETDQVTPEIDAQARSFVNEGYQLLLTFESETEAGGFNWWGDATPGNIVLTAAGMQMLNDMSQILEIDRAVIDRAHAWMTSKQSSDGSWDFNSSTHSDIQNMTQDATRATAFVVWSLAETGYDGASLPSATAYLKARIDQEDDVYTLALMANALAAVNRNSADLERLLGRLHDARIEEEDLVSWTTAAASAMGSHGGQADIETTALVALAMIRAETYPADVQGAINWLSGEKDTFGQWGSTQATVLALRAMIASLGATGEAADATISVKLDQEVVEEIVVDDFNSEVVQLVDLRDLTGEGRHEIEVQINGSGNLFYQIVQVHNLPWDQLGGAEEGPLGVSVDYDRTQLEVDGVVTGTVTVTNSDAALADMVMVELGLPPGFDLDRSPLDQAVQQGRIARFETRPRLLVVYLMGVEPGVARTFEYRLVARTPLRAQVPRARVYSYYNPDVQAFQAPVELTVE